MSKSAIRSSATSDTATSRGRRRLRLRLRRRAATTLTLALVVTGAAPLALTTSTASAAGAGSSAPASADPPLQEYSATRTIPVAPTSSYGGSGGGDGWALAMTPRAVYNVFHHQSTLQVACHLQTTGEECGSPRTITDDGVHFGVNGQPGLAIDQQEGVLYVYATRQSDQTGGVVCVDLLQDDDVANPFCGFTELTPPGEAAINGGLSTISGPIQVGRRWYAFNYVTGAGITGARNQMLCFDLFAGEACAGQPFAVGLPDGTYTNGSFPSPPSGRVGTRVMVPATIDGTPTMACFDGVARTPCAGSWPVDIPGGYVGTHGSSFPMLTSNGTTSGVCLPTGSADDCWTLSGAPTSAPAGMTAALPGNSPWNGPAFTLGARVYLANGNSDTVGCYDFAASAGCDGFPRPTPGAGYIYTVNPDPQRPTCIWVNADFGSAQLQNFDAYSGGGCTNDPTRVLASSFVIDTPDCVPDEYTELAVLSPARGDYTDGTVSFIDGNGQPFGAIADRTLDADGAVDLTDLELNSETGLPQFLISLAGLAGEPSSVTVRLTWLGADESFCVPSGGITVTPRHGYVDEPFTATYSCLAAPTVTFTRPDGSPADDVTVGPEDDTEAPTYTRDVTMGSPGRLVAHLTCEGTEVTSWIFDAVSRDSAAPTISAPRRIVGRQVVEITGTTQPRAEVGLLFSRLRSPASFSLRKTTRADNRGRYQFNVDIRRRTSWRASVAGAPLSRIATTKVVMGVRLRATRVRAGTALVRVQLSPRRASYPVRLLVKGKPSRQVTTLWTNDRGVARRVVRNLPQRRVTLLAKVPGRNGILPGQDTKRINLG